MRNNRALEIGKYTISLDSYSGNKDKIQIQITDDGEGGEFNKEDFLKVIDKFYNDNF